MKLRDSTVVQVAGDGGIGEDEVVDVGVELECWKISSSVLAGGDVATNGWAKYFTQKYQNIHITLSST